MNIPNILGGKRYKNTPLYAALYGLKKCLKAHCGLSDVPIISHDDFKAHVRYNNPQSETEQIEFPYAYLVLSSLSLNPDFTPAKNVQRQGSSIAISNDGFQDATIVKGFLFPAIIRFEFNYLSNDIQDMFFLAEKLIILARIDNLSFQITIPDTNSWFAQVLLEGDEISFEPKTLEDPANPGVYTIRTQLTVRTKIGLTKAVPKINTEGIITGNLIPDPIET